MEVDAEAPAAPKPPGPSISAPEKVERWIVGEIEERTGKVVRPKNRDTSQFLGATIGDRTDISARPALTDRSRTDSEWQNMQETVRELDESFPDPPGEMYTTTAQHPST
eukprot:TRINITY_DN67055_c8_g6_i1.p1 TRINITY_DN67055_c8_g6~~TRINITY_DN67055_c8_g6_i1.p1  ORF type:complete len:117 (-),score=4.83 TRINITY_DN67055_c8_g6_i1:237-563(-)